jgi:tetratricopeptide (TPR) repeat protein
LPLLNLALGQVIQKSLPACIRDDAAGVLLTASKIGDMPSRQSAVTLATKILGDQPPEHLQVALAHQKSTLLRIVADWEQSEHVIQDLCRRTAGLDHSRDVIQRFYRNLQPSMENKRLNALYGRLHVSHLENLLQSEHYRSAAEEIEDWKISQKPSLMEQCVFRSKTVVVAKLFRCQGRFHDVVHTLEECLKLLFPQMNRIQLICNLADAHSDLGSPDVAYAHLSAEIEAQRKKSARGKQFRRLWICAIDADLERGRYDSAQKTVQEIETVYSGLSDLDATDQLLHVRVLLAAARIHFYNEQFSEALGAFTVLNPRVQEYRSLKSDGFVYALAHLSICLVNLKTGNVGECKKTFDYARTIIYKEWPDFWIPTAPRWLRYISSEIHSMTGWTLITRTPLISEASGAFLTSIT